LIPLSLQKTAGFENHRPGAAVSRLVSACLLALGMLAGSMGALAGDSAVLISQTVTNGTPVMPRTVFTQTWTFANVGTTTWSPTFSGYTLNILTNNNGLNDCLGGVPTTNKTYQSATLSACIDSGQSVARGEPATFTMSFIAPEASGSYTDRFELNSASSFFFGPTVTVQVVVLPGDPTNYNVYDRARAVSYANNYSGYVNIDGYFWTNGSSYGTFPPGSPAPASGLGDDCAHFVSCCIGSEPSLWGGGLNIPTRDVTYGEPGAGHLVNQCLIGQGYAVEVFSLTNMSPGDVVGWNWEGDTNILDLDHVTFYLGNGLLASHSGSALEVSASTNGWYNGVRHLIHIFDNAPTAPILASRKAGNNLVMTWHTNWSGYTLQWSTNLSARTAWTSSGLKSPVTVGTNSVLTNTLSSKALFYRLLRP